jgi:hypothetical protein
MNNRNLEYDHAIDYEAWRLALIAFYQAETPWMTQKCANLKCGEPFTKDDLRVLAGLVAAAERMPLAA